jgi:hypothetical protein
MQRPCALLHPIEMGKKSTWFPPPIRATLCTAPPVDRVGEEPKKSTWFPPPIPRPVPRLVPLRLPRRP